MDTVYIYITLYKLLMILIIAGTSRCTFDIESALCPSTTSLVVAKMSQSCGVVIEMLIGLVIHQEFLGI